MEPLPQRSLPGLSEALKPRGGCLSKLCSLLPVKVLSYVLLPWTLPVESAVAVVQRCARGRRRVSVVEGGIKGEFT